MVQTLFLFSPYHKAVGQSINLQELILYRYLSNEFANFLNRKLSLECRKLQQKSRWDAGTSSAHLRPTSRVSWQSMDANAETVMGHES